VSETEFTPGPWRRGWEHGTKIEIISREGATIATVCGGGIVNAVPMEANAALLLEAPNLYAAAHSLLGWLAKGGHDIECDAMAADLDDKPGPMPPCSCGYSESIKASRAALARARGETP
jgi:hypothetical protein